MRPEPRRSNQLSVAEDTAQSSSNAAADVDRIAAEPPPEWPPDSSRSPLAQTQPPLAPPTPQVAEAYRICGEIAKREARNFYYAFRALPHAKRDAICAVYAFMRHADDLSDDENQSHDQRRIALDSWMAAWHVVESATPGESVPAKTGSVNDAVFLALADAQRRFEIPSSLLDELVQGTAMDLRRADSGRQSETTCGSTHALHFDTYETFDELYRYCYLVASVVGLVCIRIFGYEDPRAEKLAEETGIAFQLTNILRDVREDAERGRIYLPLDDMQRLGVTADELAHLGTEKPGQGKLDGGHHPTLNQRELLALQARRAEHYYQSAQALLPLISADSRPAMWVLVTIYHRLLQRIVARNFDVFSEKVSVPTTEKLWILLRGMVRVFVYRTTGYRSTGARAR